MAKFVDYKKNPGFWFAVELSIAEEVCKHPEYSAKFKTYELNEIDFSEAFDEGLIWASLSNQTRLRVLKYG